jgi:hypothetical protein
MLIDARIPVHFTDQVPQAARSDQVLILPEDDAGVPPSDQRWAAVIRLPDRTAFSTDAHPPGCSCCNPRPASAVVLTKLFQARARGEIGFFRSVVASLPAPAAADLRAALFSDSFVAGCFVESKTVE